MREEEEFNPNEMKLTKIPLGKFVTILNSLYEKGVEYIDIIGIMDEEEDYVGISIIREYLSKELREKFDSLAEEDEFLDNINNAFDDDINDLI